MLYNYINCLKKYLTETLLIANYDKDDKRHACKIEKSPSKIKFHETSHRIGENQCHLFYSRKTMQNRHF